MTAIELLERCRGADGEIKRIERRITDLRETMENVSPRVNDAGASRGAFIHDRVAEFVARIDELEAKKRVRALQQSDEILAVTLMLDTFPDREHMVIYQFYVMRKSAEAIAKDEHFSERHVCRLKARAVTRLTAMTPEEVHAFLPPWYEQPVEGAECEKL